jgi:hypothetical protein
MLSLLISLFLLSTDHCLVQSSFTLTNITIDKGNTEKEVIRGNLYLLDDPAILFEVTSPLSQLMWIKRDTTDIYYPDENKFFRILSHDTLPTTSTTVSQMMNFDFEHRLHEAGLKIVSVNMIGDTLFFHWEPKKKTLVKFPEIVTGSIGDNLVVYRGKGKGWSLELKLADYVRLKGRRTPLFMRSKLVKGKLTRIEELRLADAATDKSLPEHLRDYPIPEDAETKVVEW